ncbi:hypothetical protein BUALT_Bualt16G0042500 [Buddleja alternifolia]|uniref:Uncharacterized protein n=1 Tax=Buddleja alternifolia TaxID=168488 RepID=A0AAV6WJS9_9LAMI|nr:hypothetical protein BUALT_Bualt16G0042500 [Buddleja alternifolia]
MDATQVSLEEFKLFHRIDRKLYVVLVKYLSRDPSECLQIMGLWLWLERGGGFCNIIGTILSLPQYLINELADEAVVCLKCINNQFPFEAAKIPLTGNLLKKDISLQFFLKNRLTVSHEVQRLVSDIYILALSDIMVVARRGGFNQSPIPSPVTLLSARQSPITVVGQSSPRGPPLSSDDSLVQYLSSLSIGGDASPCRTRVRQNEASQSNRTMFATFSKGYPVTEAEVWQLLTRIFGECIESLHMQEVMHGEQALYARVVFLRPSFIQIILDGESMAKFTINGKHVWMRKFLLRGARATLPCGCPSVGPSTCPHNQ